MTNRTTSLGRVAAVRTGAGEGAARWGRGAVRAVWETPTGPSAARVKQVSAMCAAKPAVLADFMRAPSGKWTAKFTTTMGKELLRHGLDRAASDDRIRRGHAHYRESAVDVGVGNR